MGWKVVLFFYVKEEEHMEWSHKCDIKWLRERQNYLTASDIKKLLPVTATGRKRKVTDLDRMRIYAHKLVDLTEDDCWSYGMAARGHELEPFAVDALNDLLDKNEINSERFYWWDDKVISSEHTNLAFSPDATNVPMLSPKEPTAIAEIKSYNDEKHFMLSFTPRNELEERWQIASAMAVRAHIDHAYLVLYNPRMLCDNVVAIPYDRDDLKKELEVISDVLGEWNRFIFELPKMSVGDRLYGHYDLPEREIMTIMELRKNINPS